MKSPRNGLNSSVKNSGPLVIDFTSVCGLITATSVTLSPGVVGSVFDVCPWFDPDREITATTNTRIITANPPAMIPQGILLVPVAPVGKQMVRRCACTPGTGSP